MLKLLIGADLVPTHNNISLFNGCRINELIGEELSEIIKKADYRVFNLETPLVDKQKPIIKCGPNLIAPTSTVKGIKSMDVNLFTLANNHILDQDLQGLYSTMQLLCDYKIGYVGAGDSLYTAAKPYIIEKEGLKVGFYACAEHEFSIAGDGLPGANPYDPLNSFDHVRELKEKCDFVTVLYHGGKEFYRYPSPMLQRIFRKFSDVGADLVIAQHTHCVGCMEMYNGSTLIYGQGNFLFSMDSNEFWNTALLVDVDIEEKGKYSCKYIPIKRNENGNGIILDKNEDTIKGFLRRSREILQDGFIEEKYKIFAESMCKAYFSKISGGLFKFLPIRIINKLMSHKLYSVLYNPKYYPAIENCFECEAHRELFVCYLQQHRMR